MTFGFQPQVKNPTNRKGLMYIYLPTDGTITFISHFSLYYKGTLQPGYLYLWDAADLIVLMIFQLLLGNLIHTLSHSETDF